MFTIHYSPRGRLVGLLATGCEKYGVVRGGQVLSAAYDPGRPDELRQEAVVSGLFLMMGRGLERLLVCPPLSSHSSFPLSFLSLVPFISCTA